MSNRIRALVMKRILNSGKEVRKLRGLAEVDDDVTEMFENMLVESSDVVLIALLEYALIDEYNHKQGNFTQTKGA